MLNLLQTHARSSLSLNYLIVDNHWVRPPLCFQLVFNRRRSTTMAHKYIVTCLRVAISERASLVERVRAHAHELLHGLNGGTLDTLGKGPTEGFILIR